MTLLLLGYPFRRSVVGVTNCCCMLYAYALITKFVVIILMLWPAATWKDFRTLWGFVFRVIFLSSPCSVELKVIFGPVAPPIDYLRYRAFPRPSHSPLFLHQLFDQLLQPLDLLASCVPACICWRVWFDLAYVGHISTGVTGQATMQIKLSLQKQFFCFQYPRQSAWLNVWRCVATSWFYVLLCIRYCCGGPNKKMNERVPVLRDLRSVSV